MTNISILGLIMYTLIPGGQLWCRVFDLNGSLEHAWTLLPFFMIFPLSIVPMLLIYFNFIRKGSGSKPFDFFLIFPLVAKIGLSFYLPNVVENSSSVFWLTELGTLGIITITKIIRSYVSCSEAKLTNNLNSGRFNQAISDSLFESGMAGIFYQLIQYIKYIPIIGQIIGPIIALIDTLFGDTVSLVFWCFGYMYYYVINNMFNQYDMRNYCNPTSFSFWTSIKYIIGFFAIMFSTLSGSLSLKSITKHGVKGFAKKKLFKSFFKRRRRRH